MPFSAPSPTVAVIIPYYNGARDIERAIKSVLAQTVPPEQFIIVDDGSRMEESAFLKNLSQTFAFELYHKENGGQGSARNFGVAQSKQNYIAFLDQDDYFFPNHIEDLVGALPENDPRFGWVYAELSTADANGTIINSHLLRNSPHIQKRNPKEGALITLLRHDLYILPSASLILKAAYEAVGGFDPQFMGYEDDDLFLRLFRAGYSNYFYDRPVTVWCVHDGSTTYSVRFSTSRLRFLRKWSALCPDNTAFHYYYFKNALLPRLLPNFIAEMIRVIVDKNPDKDAYFANWCAFVATVKANRSVFLFTKFGLDILTLMLRHAPTMVLVGIRPLYLGLKKLLGR